MKDHFYAFADVLKHAEGGKRKQDILDHAENLGIKAKTGPSPYVGLVRVLVKTENKRTLKKFANRLGV